MIRKSMFIIIATFITCSLFLLMRYLITPVGEPPTELPEDTSIVITRTIRDENPVINKRIPPPSPVQEEEPAPPPVIRTNPSDNTTSDLYSVSIPPINGGGNEFPQTQNRRATPIVTIPPQYPNTALQNNVEGWVLVEFTITTAGTVENVTVVEAEPERIFNRETIRAIKRWKYQPKLVNGKPVQQFNMREIFRFELKK